MIPSNSARLARPTPTARAIQPPSPAAARAAPARLCSAGAARALRAGITASPSADRAHAPSIRHNYAHR